MPDLGSYDLQTWLTAVTLVVTVAGWLVDRLVVRRRRLSYRVHWDRPVDVTPAAAHSMNLTFMRNGASVPEPSLVVLRVENVGSADITEADLLSPLECSFGGRRIVHYEVQDTEPESLASVITGQDGDGAPQIVPSRQEPSGALKLPPFSIPRRARFKLLVLLSGSSGDVVLSGDLRGGEIAKETRRGPRSRTGLALGGASLLLAGLLGGLFLTQDKATPAAQPPPVACPAGNAGPVSLAGSTALKTAMDALQAEYRKACPTS